MKVEYAMKAYEIERVLRGFDFSLCHPIRERLLRELLHMQCMDNRSEADAADTKTRKCATGAVPPATRQLGPSGACASLEQKSRLSWTAGLLSDDNLDYATAAGNPAQERKPDS